jgi:glutamate racemase
MLGILDSGVGGLSVWKELKELSSKKGALYFADTARVPYGNLTIDKIFIYSKDAISHLIDQQLY